MPIDIGYIGNSCNNGEISAFIHYQTGFVPDEAAGQTYMDAPLVDGPRGYCFDMTNRTGARAEIVLTDAAGGVMTIVVAQGDPVISGPSSGRSRTAAQMAALGYTTRGSVAGFSLAC